MRKFLSCSLGIFVSAVLLAPSSARAQLTESDASFKPTLINENTVQVPIGGMSQTVVMKRSDYCAGGGDASICGTGSKFDATGACPPGQSYVGTVGGRCVATDRDKDDDDAAGGNNNRPGNQNADAQRQACIARVRQAASACESAKGGATRSCDANSNSQLNALNTEGQQLNRDLQNEATKAAACQKNGDYQRRVGEATRQFQSTCQQGVTSCSNACQQVPASAQGCADAPEVRSALQASQANNQTCTGELQTRATQAGQQQQGQAQTAQTAQICQTDSTASGTPTPGGTGTGPDQVTPPSSGTGTANLGGGPAPDYQEGAYQGDVAGLDQRNGGAKLNGDGTDSEIGAPRGMVDSLASLPTRQSYAGGGGDGGGGGFQGTPGFNGTSDDDAPPGTARAAKMASSDDGGSAGGRGRRAGRPYIPRRLAGLAGLDEDALKAAKADGGDELPDLSKFRPNMTPAQRRAALASLGIHGSEVNFFTKVHDRYVALQHTFEAEPILVLRRAREKLKPRSVVGVCRPQDLPPG